MRVLLFGRVAIGLCSLILYFVAVECVAESDDQTDATADCNSIHDLLSVREFEKFRAGDEMSTILKDLCWRGNLVEAADRDGKRIYLISFRLFTDNAKGLSGESALAVFVNERFEKFVSDPPGPTPKRAVGEFPLISHAMRSEAVTLAQFVKKADSRSTQVDPGLTFTWLLLSPLVKAGQLARTAELKEQYAKNTQLRDQYNASRLKIGMNQEDVQRLFKAKPFEIGTANGLAFEFYGSQVHLDEMGPHLH
jgi:hypothetical protein